MLGDTFFTRSNISIAEYTFIAKVGDGAIVFSDRKIYFHEIIVIEYEKDHFSYPALKLRLYCFKWPFPQTQVSEGDVATMGFTEHTTQKVLEWQNFNRTDTPAKIFEFLNSRENLCTPGFLLRKELQIKFSKLVKQAAEQSDTTTYADLAQSGNIAWPEIMIQYLSKSLEQNDSVLQLKIEKEQWERYLTDKSRCRQQTATKLIFALKMDSMTAEKFLLANGLVLWSWRNPRDYAYKVCLECGATFAEAENLFNEFTEKCDDNKDSINGMEDINKDFTQPIKNETKNILKNGKIPFEKLKPKILQTMCHYEDCFCCKNAPGYSIQQLQCLRLLLKYLTILYPNFNRLTRQKLVNEPMGINADGTPKTLAHLVDSMLKSQGIGVERFFPEKPFPEYWELEEYGGPNIPERGHVREIYHNIPFTRNVLIPLNRLSETLRAILRVIEQPNNAQNVDRDTVLILSYFLITGLHYSDTTELKNKLLNTLNKDKSAYKNDSAQELLVNIICDIFDSLDDNVKNNLMPQPRAYVDWLNMILATFEFPKFYAPFAIDRFILLCLLDKSLMSRVISESYRLSNLIVINQ